MHSTASRTNPLRAILHHRSPLNPTSSDGCTFHLEISIPSDEPLYRPGDALGIFPKNPYEQVEELLTLLHFSGEEILPSGLNLREFLTSKANLRTPSRKLAEAVIPLTLKREELTELLTDHEKWRTWITNHSVNYFLNCFPSSQLPLDQLEGLFSSLLPRLYSIASTPTTHPNKIALTIAHVSYTADGEKHFGICSNFLYTLPLGAELLVYPHHTKDFLLPAEPTPIIMICAGTGIAPFRSFILEMLAQKERGSPTSPLWLFFGEKRAAQDFFYKDELDLAIKEELLQIDTAFSRDGEKKFYIQERLNEQRELFWEWMEKGALLYICGSADKLGKSVEEVLCRIIEEKLNLTTLEAIQHLRQWRKDHRYKRDLY